ncbi:uncharacterized protein SAMN02745163_03536 [Clostridium cavendishii DSM 21758]|uniref:Radical SAM core domain-containing protein n=1 Tax=Clostridium cavendishii DSM 21758 TaxID=1121302 RepID=A0A1M6R452_9CLOT|nr:Cys-rich peptide radical SAM maturase CcpM [Clostridium cavendishii]SHK27108.1 uncharacterized protein SAMN02745163_03536 [Clostridium cavendishii DSM 21758]
MNNRPFINLFKTRGAYYVYDVNRNSILRTEKKVWESLNQDCNDEKTYENNTIKNLKERGFLSPNKVEGIVHPTNEIIEDYLNSKISMLDFQVTQQCNFRCEYCSYSGAYENRVHSNKRMTFELAKKGVDFLIEHSVEQKHVYVGFYGGEPLIEFELIKKIIEYIKKNAYGKDVRYTLTTNATLLNEEIIDFLYKNDFTMTISLDGPKEVHDKSRKFALNSCGTFDKVIEKIKLIKQVHPEFMEKISFNAVVDPMKDISCVCKFFDNYETVKEAMVIYSEISENYTKKETSVDEKYYQNINYEYFKLLLSKLNKFDEKRTSKLVRKRFLDLETTYRYLRPTEKLLKYMHHAGPCIPGAQRLFLNADGDFYPCERVSETSEAVKIGNIENGLDTNKVLNILNIGKISEENCKNCWAIRFCSLCIAAIDDGNGASKELKLKRCQVARKTAENKFMDICALKEFGYKFTKGKNTNIIYR